MTGTIINGAAIIAGGVAGLSVHTQFPMTTQNWVKMDPGVKGVWDGINTHVEGTN